MLGLPPKDVWLAGLILASIGAFAATARFAGRLSDPRAIIAGSIGFSLLFTALALVSGLAVLRD